MSKTVKQFLIAGIIIVVGIIGIYLSMAFGLFYYKSYTKDVHKVVCDNIDIRYQWINNITVTDEMVHVQLSQRLLPNLMKMETDDVNFYSMFNIYNTLSEMYEGKKINVLAGATGSNGCTMSIYSGKLSYYSECNDDSCVISMEKLLDYVLSQKNIVSMEIEYVAEQTFDSLAYIPENTHIKHLMGQAEYSNNISVITAFQGLESLDLAFYPGESSDIVDMSFLKDFKDLEELTIHGNIKRFDFSNTELPNIKKFTFKTSTVSDEEKALLYELCPSAEIVIDEDSHSC